MKHTYQPETAGSIMSTHIVICPQEFTVAQALEEISRDDIDWEDNRHVYVVDEHHRLLGFVPITHLIQRASTHKLSDFMQTFAQTVHVSTDQEAAVFSAVKNDLDAIPVLEDGDRLAGTITPRAIIDILHNEHVEDVLFASGISRKEGNGFLQLAKARIWPVLVSRAPWLVGGALIGILLGFVSSQFQASIEKTVALAYFIPVVAYIADSVGTQSEAITIRALATLKLNYVAYILREVTIGLLLGLLLGCMGALGAFLISGDAKVSLVVGISLVAASTLATGLASLIPILFRALGKDPALGSGPLATALQDVLSILVYFVCAMVIIGV